MAAQGAPITAVTCLGLTVSPGPRPILAGVDLDLGDGSLTTLVGPSGAGKTTLLRALAGLAPISAGSITFDGTQVADLPAHRRGVGLVFQQPRLFPHLTAAENVAFPLRLKRMRRAARLGVARDLLGEVGLLAVADQPAGLLSGGEAQRVSLARAIAAEPQVLLLDEPFAAVDPNRRDALRRLLVKLQRDRRLTTLLVTHDRDEAVELGEHVAVLLGGRIVQQETPRILLTRPCSPAVAAFLGSATIIRGGVQDGYLAIAGALIPAPGPDGPAAVTIRPEHVSLDETSSLRLRVRESRVAAAHVRLLLDGHHVEIEAHVPPADAPPTGALVGVRLDPDQIWRFPDADSDYATDAAPVKTA